MMSYSSHPKTSLWGLSILTEPVEKQALPLLLESHGASWGLAGFLDSMDRSELAGLH